MASTNDKYVPNLTAAGVLVSLGIIYGDIGTSPIYTLRFIIGKHEITEELVFGGLSCVFWTLTLITTVKYVYLALSADNKGEGGIFALYALVRRYKASWVIYPAIIGCATLISDGFLTPAFSVTSAIEGLRVLNPEISSSTIISIVIGILVALFLFQQFGSGVVGRTFGPIMLIWFSFIAVIGLIQLSQNTRVLLALNPVYAFNLLVKYPGGFWILGAVFLCTTGAEAMYSDLGHCGKSNIRVGWGFVKLALLLSYFGQGAWLLDREGQLLEGMIPFFEIIPDSILIFAILLATLATIIASQALISGTFTLVNEAMKLKLWPSTRVRYPSQIKGQIYIPAINWILLLGSILVVLIFNGEPARMEGAYGLAITFDMLMTTSLLIFYFSVSRKSTFRAAVLALAFFSIEGAFLISNLSKFVHGGWFTFTIASVFFLMMFILMRARRLRERHT
jgi:KUP system potassium uptake protein